MISPRKILAIKFRSLGDTAIMTAPLMALKKEFPSSEIHVAVTDKWAPILENHPAVDQIWSYTRHQDKASRIKAITRLSLKLRKEKFDWAINFHASTSSSILAFASGAKVRSIHHHGHKHPNRFSTVEVPGKGVLKPIIERDLDTVRALGVKTDSQSTVPLLFVSDEESQTAKNLVSPLQKPILAMGLGASRPTKCWPAESFAKVAQDWIDHTQGSVMTFGTSDQQQLYETFEKSLGNHKKSVENFIDLPLRKMMALLQKCTLFCGNDSGLKHMAISLGLNSVTMIGPEHPFEWHPYPIESHPYFFIDHLKCRKDGFPGMPAWCGLNICIKEGHKCMKNIEPKQVSETCIRLWKS